MGYKLYPNEESYTEVKAKAYKKNRKIVKSLMIKKISMQLYQKVQVKYLSH